ncbi:hypothetical protein [Bosea massiliensis]|uniref:Uncharacterized protein n=1 Tax=Bosea massiliensis TaxID=151419 RepID=A0ABW0P0V4_9HYPH
MQIKVKASGETEAFWKNDVYGVRMHSVIGGRKGERSFVSISFKRASKGGGVLDFVVELPPEVFSELTAAMARADRDAAVVACCGVLLEQMPLLFPGAAGPSPSSSTARPRKPGRASG